MSVKPFLCRVKSGKIRFNFEYKTAPTVRMRKHKENSKLVLKTEMKKKLKITTLPLVLGHMVTRTLIENRGGVDVKHRASLDFCDGCFSKVT